MRPRPPRPRRRAREGSGMAVAAISTLSMRAVPATFEGVTVEVRRKKILASSSNAVIEEKSKEKDVVPIGVEEAQLFGLAFSSTV